MYPKNSYVFHTYCGVCQVIDVAPLPSDPGGNLYYVLKPLYGDDSNNTVRVPFDNPASLRRPLDKDLAEHLIANWPDHTTNLYVTDSKARKQAYEAALRSGMVEDLALLLEGALQRKAKDGHLNSMDAQFVTRAAPIIFGELGFALGMSPDEAKAYVLKRTGR